MAAKFNYIIEELEKVERGHDWSYFMTIVVTGSGGKTKHLSINREQYKKIKEAMTGNISGIGCIK